MHFGGAMADGCSGIGAWVVNTLLNAALLWVFLHCYGTRGVCDDDAVAAAVATGTYSSTNNSLVLASASAFGIWHPNEIR
ncbi:hypothetical protein CFC21_026139 [Triticum aestivum]|uniref:Uncharacterized protein n=2 Tax=Triticum aestivum TaxID=4565 RepID=A0A3B6CFB1_WHEAT|nr:hypothetical protein CFC21_026139 [Triticum aestivum]